MVALLAAGLAALAVAQAAVTTSAGCCGKAAPGKPSLEPEAPAAGPEPAGSSSWPNADASSCDCPCDCCLLKTMMGGGAAPGPATEAAAVLEGPARPWGDAAAAEGSGIGSGKLEAAAAAAVEDAAVCVAASAAVVIAAVEGRRLLTGCGRCGRPRCMCTPCMPAGEDE